MGVRSWELGGRRETGVRSWELGGKEMEKLDNYQLSTKFSTHNSEPRTSALYYPPPPHSLPHSDSALTSLHPLRNSELYTNFPTRNSELGTRN
uniref:Uncharacterized protein n=1 Tax=Desertifilum tharense IPPAS B-1220 TaxID=1781255 RepID=A0ACD5H1C5_9CYAN